jgi:hypothetical protein
MSHRSVNPERLEFLLGHGLSDEEIKQFFRECKAQLIIANEKKAQTSPADREEATKRITRFAAKANVVLGVWLKKHVIVESEDLREQLAPRFSAIEREGVRFSSDEIAELCRCGLVALYDPNPPDDWIQFLMSEPPGEASNLEQNDLVVTSDSQASKNAFRAAELVSLIQCARGEISEKDISNSDLRFIAQLYACARVGNRTVTIEWPSNLDDLAQLQAVLDSSIPTPMSEEKQGVRALAPPVRSFDSDCDYLQYLVVATRSKYSTNGPWFLDVEAFVGDDGVFTLEDADMRIAVPDEGRLILFPEAGITPGVGEPLALRVEGLKRTSKPIKVGVKSSERVLIPIVYVPSRSDEPDAVREWISTYAKPRDIWSAIFVTSDGLCLKAGVEPLKRVLAKDFDWILESWSQMMAFEFSGGAYSVEPLPPSVRPYDCAPLAVSARRLLKSLAERNAVGITKTQLSNVLTHIREEDGTKTDARYLRIAGKLEKLEKASEDYDALIEEVMQAPSVIADIETRKQAAVTQLRVEADVERKILANLRRDKAVAQEALDRLKAETDQRVKDMRGAIQRAFETAKAKGAETLAEIALWQVISPDERPSKSVQFSSVEFANPQYNPVVAATTMNCSAQSTADVLRNAGFPDPTCDLYAAALGVAVKVGVPIAVDGPGATSVGRHLVASMAKSPIQCFDVPIGILARDTGLFDRGPAVLEAPLLFTNANLSDAALYAPQFLEAVAERFLKPPKPAYEPLILIGASGQAGLPWPPEIDHLAIQINLSHPPASREDVLQMNADPVCSPLKSKVRRRLETACADEPDSHLVLALLLRLSSPPG